MPTNSGLPRRTWGKHGGDGLGVGTAWHASLHQVGWAQEELFSQKDCLLGLLPRAGVPPHPPRSDPCSVMVRGQCPTAGLPRE